jgi:hypothetical protein
VSGNRDWDKEMAKIDKQLESVSDAQMFPEKKGAAPAQKAQVAADRETTKSWPAILRLAISVALGVGILFWPYATRCGFGLTGYLVAVTAVLSILLLAWGLVLGATEILPRIGYAKQPLPWSCTIE